MPVTNYRWFIEVLGPHEGHLHGINRVLFSAKTPYQTLDIMELGSYGKALVLDGKIQSTLTDEFIYHEILVHPAMLAHPEPRRVFIVGGGEGATLREVLKHRLVERVLMVDIDEEVVRQCKKFLPEWHQGAFDDPRVELRYLDARRYLEESSEVFDVIIIDSSEPVEEGPAYLLFTKEFYEVVKVRLSSHGILSLQAGPMNVADLKFFSAIQKTLQTVFPLVWPYWAAIPSFAYPWGFSLASKEVDPQGLSASAVEKLIAERIEGELRYYDGITHKLSFLLPKPIRKHLAKEDRIIEDNHPLFIFH